MKKTSTDDWELIMKKTSTDDWELIEPAGLGFKIFVSKRNYLGGESHRSGMYGKDFQQCLREFLPVGGVFVDVGANVGIFTFAGSQQVGGGGVVYAFEPSSENFGKLTEAAKINESNNVIFCQRAMGTGLGKVVLHLNPSAGGHSLLEREATVGTELVDTGTLDMALWGLRRDVDLLKIDVEGAELDVLAGAAKTLQKTRAVDIDIHHQDGIREQDVSAVMLAAGFAKVRVNEWHGFYVRNT